MAKAIKTAKVSKYIVGEKAIMAAATELQTEAKSFRERMHHVLISALNHINGSGDCRVLDQVFATVDKAMNRRGITTWVREVSNLQPLEQNKVVVFRKPADEKIAIDMAKADGTPFWDFEANPIAKPFDLNAALMQLITRAKSTLDKKKEIIRVGTGDDSKPADITSYQNVLKGLEDFAKGHTVKALTAKAAKAAEKVAKRGNATASEAPAIH